MVKASSISPALRSVISQTTAPVGSILDLGYVRVRCVEHAMVESSMDACKGCYFSLNNKTCPSSQCSSFGRTDGKNVWFVEVSEEDEV